MPGKSNKPVVSTPRPTWLTIHDVAAELQVDYRTIWAEVRCGNLPASRVGAQWRISRESLDAYLAPVLP